MHWSGFEDLTKAKNLEVEPHIGLEQEFFLIPREAYLRRSDIQLCGRSILGRFPARGQEACDHYMAPISGSQTFTISYLVSRVCN